MSNTFSKHQDVLERAEFWSNELSDMVMDETMIKNYVEFVDFPHGNKFVRPVIGDLDVNAYKEDEAIKYMPLDSGRFEFEITEYVSSGTYITEKARQDLVEASQIEASFVPKMNRAIQYQLEAFLMKQGQPTIENKPHKQLADDPNTIAGYDHRMIGSNVVNGRRMLDVTDFAKANLALSKINVPTANRVAFVDSANAYILETATNLVNFSDNPMWEGIVTTGLTDGKRFVRNIFGVDIYTSEFLPYAGTDGDGSVETIRGVSTQEGAIANIMFSATEGMLPFLASWRQQPKVEGEFNKDFQREEYVVTARYGAAPQNRHNFITMLSDDLANTAL